MRRLTVLHRAVGPAPLRRRRPAARWVVALGWSIRTTWNGVRARRVLRELANEQLNPGGRKDKFVAAMEGAQTPDCLGTNQTGQVNQGQVSFNGLFAAPAIAAQALQGKCK